MTGINFCPDFVGEDADVNAVCDHICHFLELDPSGKHIALGSDFDGISGLPKGITGIESYEAVASELQNRGVSDEMIMDIYWNNAMGVL